MARLVHMHLFHLTITLSINFFLLPIAILTIHWKYVLFPHVHSVCLFVNQSVFLLPYPSLRLYQELLSLSLSLNSNGYGRELSLSIISNNLQCAVKSEQGTKENG